MNKKTKDEKGATVSSNFSRWIGHHPRAIFNGFEWYVQLDPEIPRDMLLDWWIRGEGKDTTNEHKIRYDKKSHRWYLKLSALDVKEIRAKVWQREDKE